jgi:hypothetical protein
MAVATDELLYIHVPKTGGTFVEAVLQRVYASRPGSFIDTSRPQDRGRFGHRDQHDPLERIPEPWRSKPLLATVRNPYDHHVSLYEFGWWKHHEHDTFDPGRIRLRYPHFPELSFPEYLAAVNDWNLVDPSAAPASLFPTLGSHSFGLLSLGYLQYLCADPDGVLADLPGLLASGGLARSFAPGTWIPMNRLNSGLHAFLRSLGHAEPELEFILDMAPVLPEGGTRASRRFLDYYDARSLELVRERERLLFELFPEFEA